MLPRGRRCAPTGYMEFATGIPALLADLHLYDLAELSDRWRHAATNQSRDEARRLLFYFLVDAVDDERARRAIAQDAPATESTKRTTRSQGPR